MWTHLWEADAPTPYAGWTAPHRLGGRPVCPMRRLGLHVRYCGAPKTLLTNASSSCRASATYRLLWPAACSVLMRAKVGRSMGVRPSSRPNVFRGLPRLAFVAGSVGLTCSIRPLSHAAAHVYHWHTISSTLSRCAVYHWLYISTTY